LVFIAPSAEIVVSTFKLFKSALVAVNVEILKLLTFKDVAVIVPLTVSGFLHSTKVGVNAAIVLFYPSHIWVDF
jgi:hypothetical protein